MTTFAKPEIFLSKIKEQLGNHNVVLITGVGKVYPFVRSHTILNNLQEVIDKIPVIMFFQVDMMVSRCNCLVNLKMITTIEHFH